MDEKTASEQATSNNDDGDKSESLTIVERASQERQRLEQENARLEKNLKELRDLEASRLLGGTAGGRTPDAPQLTEEEKKKREALEFWKGTAIEDAILKHG